MKVTVVETITAHYEIQTGETSDALEAAVAARSVFFNSLDKTEFPNEVVSERLAYIVEQTNEEFHETELDQFPISPSSKLAGGSW